MKPTPWYKHFWPWFLMFFPVATIVACIGLVVFAVGNGPDMVVDDYYKKGKAIDLELSKFNKAKALYLHGDLNVESDFVEFKFTKGDFSKVTALKASFYHRTIKKHDFEGFSNETVVAQPHSFKVGVGPSCSRAPIFRTLVITEKLTNSTNSNSTPQRRKDKR